MRAVFWGTIGWDGPQYGQEGSQAMQLNEHAILNRMKKRLRHGIAVTKYSRAIKPRTVSIKAADEDCSVICFEHADPNDHECDPIKTSTLKVRRATDPDPEYEHYAGSRVLRDNLDPNHALQAFIFEGPDNLTINFRASSQSEAERLITGFTLLFNHVREQSKK